MRMTAAFADERDGVRLLAADICWQKNIPKLGNHTMSETSNDESLNVAVYDRVSVVRACHQLDVTYSAHD